jgi:flagellar assembly protein FliH
LIERDFARILKPSGADSATVYQPAAIVLLGSDSGPDQGPDREQQAYERGVAAGEQQVRQEVAVLVERQGQLLENLIQELKTTRELLLKDAEEPIAALALEIARKVLHDEAAALRDAIVAQAREAIARVREGGPVKVLVNPQDVPLLEDAREAIAKTFEETVTLQVVGDARISKGGCIVETPVRLVDARIEVQLARIAEALKQKGNGQDRNRTA